MTRAARCQLVQSYVDTPRTEIVWQASGRWASGEDGICNLEDLIAALDFQQSQSDGRRRLKNVEVAQHRGRY
jgi:hypothetical protein